GFDRIFIFSDSLEALQIVQGSATKVSNSTLDRRINLQLAKLSQRSIQHVSRAYNKEANSLAKMSITNNGGTQFFEMPPWGLIRRNDEPPDLDDGMMEGVEEQRASFKAGSWRKVTSKEENFVLMDRDVVTKEIDVKEKSIESIELKAMLCVTFFTPIKMIT
ncbi:hypothetical protein Goari_013725, partial [Gossypium aridum]|nr:hypothetical protein [Gossypium aridum]